MEPTPHTTPPPTPSQPWRPVVIILAAVILVYAQSLRFGFVNYDDDELVYRNSSFLADWGNAGTAFTTHAFVGAGGESVYYRPLLLVSYIADYHLWGLRPVGYHLTNLLLHALVALLVYRLALGLAGGELAALAAALLFALHPVQTESVAWVAGRNDLLLGLFVALAALSAIGAARAPERERRFLFLSAAAFALALFTKETAVFYLPLFPLLDQFARGGEKRSLAESLKRFLPHGALVLLYLGVRLAVFGALVGAERLYGHRTMAERLLTLPAIVAEHLRLLVAPLNLSVAHPLNELLWTRSPWTIASLLIVAAFLLLVWRSVRQREIGLLWVAAGLVPVLGLVPVPIPILEHRLYVPLIGVALAVAPLVAKRTAASATPALILLAVILATASVVRLPVWRDGISLFTDAVAKAPSYAPSHFSLAGAYYEVKRYDEGIAAIRHYRALAPTDLRGALFLRDMLYAKGEYRAVAELTREMTRLEPGNAQRFLEAGAMYEELRLLDSAAVVFRGGIVLHETSDDLQFRLGVVSRQLGRTREAEEAFRRVIQLNPSSTGAYVLLGTLYAETGRGSEAIAVLEAGLTMEQPPRDLVELLHTLYRKQGDRVKDEALSQRFPTP